MYICMFSILKAYNGSKNISFFFFFTRSRLNNNYKYNCTLHRNISAHKQLKTKVTNSIWLTFFSVGSYTEFNTYLKYKAKSVAIIATSNKCRTVSNWRLFRFWKMFKLCKMKVTNSVPFNTLVWVCTAQIVTECYNKIGQNANFSKWK